MEVIKKNKLERVWMYNLQTRRGYIHPVIKRRIPKIRMVLKDSDTLSQAFSGVQKLFWDTKAVVGWFPHPRFRGDKQIYIRYDTSNTDIVIEKGW